MTLDDRYLPPASADLLKKLRDSRKEAPTAPVLKVATAVGLLYLVSLCLSTAAICLVLKLFGAI